VLVPFALSCFAVVGCTGPAPEQPAAPAPAGVAARGATGAGDPHPDASALSADAGAVAPEAPFTSKGRFALLIRGGTVIDGSGRPGAIADVLVQGDRIAHVGIVDSSVQAAKVIDATGKVVTPGFIDTHAHGDAVGDNRNFLAMGVTTLCLGQDGRSPSDERIATWAKGVEAKKPVLNLVPFVGHASVRVLAGVGAKTDPSPAQIAAMAALVAQGMEDGAFGLTTGLEYQPGRSGKLAELVEIAKPVAKSHGVVMSHMRSEDDDAIDGALDELLAQGTGSGARVHVSHLKVVYGHGKERAEKLLARLQAARDKGLAVTADMYPYNASYTGIDIVFPDWAKPPSSFDAAVRSRHEELRAWLRKRIALRNGPEATLFGTGRFAGKTLAAAAAETRKPFEDLLIDDIGPSGASAAYFVMDDALQNRLIVDPHVMIGSDGSGGGGHPRGHGAFARVLRVLVNDDKLLGLEEAVHKMSGLAAETLDLDRQRRGLVRVGFAADLLVFDPAKVRDTATFQRPTELAEGFESVVVNGQLVRDHGAFTRARPGQVLRHAAPGP